MRQFIIFTILVCAVACKSYQGVVTHRGNNSRTLSVLNVTEKETVKDSALNVAAPVENSSNSIYRDSSYLQTSLAWSRAVVSNGKLTHQIGNKPTIPVPAKIIYRTREVLKLDSVIVRDTIYQNIETIKTNGISWWVKLWAAVGKLAALVVVVGWIWYKIKK